MTTRATITLPTDLYNDIAQQARLMGKSFSELSKELMSVGLQQKRSEQIEQSYAALWEFAGTGDPSVTDASTTIDQLLYGKKSEKNTSNE